MNASLTTGFIASELLYGRPIQGLLQNLNERCTEKKSAPTNVISYIFRLQEIYGALRQASTKNEELK